MTILDSSADSVSRSDTPFTTGASGAATDVALDPHRLSARLAELAREHRVPGAQLAIHHGGETVAVQTGEQRHRADRAVAADSAFPLGSVSKAFTATVAMVLVADEDVELDAPLDEYLPELSELGSVLTLRRLLSHTGGLVADPETLEGPQPSIRRYALEHCRAANLVQAPGTAFSYSNLGYVLAGLLIETVTGMAWWEATEAILLRPLGIAPAFVPASPAAGHEREIVSGHSVHTATGRVRPVEQSLEPARAPAGGLAASALDLVALGRLHLGDAGAGELLPARHAGQLRAAVPAAEPFGIADGWGLGLALFRCADTWWAGHDGNAEGTACYLRFEPDSGCVVGFTSNATTGVEMWHDLAADLRAAGLPVATGTPVTTRAGSADMRRGGAVPDCAGTYRNGDAEYVVNPGADGALGLLVDGELVATLVCDVETCVFAQCDPESGAWLPPGRFLRDPVTGEIDRIQVDGRVARRRVCISGERC